MMAAADRCMDEVVLYLLQVLQVTRLERILAYELLGASCANDKDFFSLGKAYKYLRIGTELRADSDDPEIREKKDLKTYPAYNGVKEFVDLAGLDAVNLSIDNMFMHCLAVRERIMGKFSLELDPDMFGLAMK